MHIFKNVELLLAHKAIDLWKQLFFQNVQFIHLVFVWHLNRNSFIFQNGMLKH